MHSLSFEYTICIQLVFSFSFSLSLPPRRSYFQTHVIKYVIIYSELKKIKGRDGISTSEEKGRLKWIHVYRTDLGRLEGVACRKWDLDGGWNCTSRSLLAKRGESKLRSKESKLCLNKIYYVNFSKRIFLKLLCLNTEKMSYSFMMVILRDRCIVYFKNFNNFFFFSICEIQNVTNSVCNIHIQFNFLLSHITQRKHRKHNSSEWF